MRRFRFSVLLSLCVAGAARAEPPGYRWAPFADNDPTCMKLVGPDGRQCGIYRWEGDVFRWLDRSTDRFGPPCQPPLVPPVRRGLNFGLAEGKIGERERYRVGDRDVPRDEALARMMLPKAAR
jgi:hypothetical protein